MLHFSINFSFSSESLAKFPRRTNSSSGFHAHSQQPEEQQQQQQQQQPQQQQQMVAQNSNNENSVQAAAVQLASTNGMQSVNNSLNSAPASSSTSTIAGLLHQNSMNSRQQNPLSNANSPYGGSGVQIPSPGSSSTIPQVQPNPSPFQSPTPSSSNNPPQPCHSGLTASAHMNSANSPNISMQQPALSGDPDPNDSQSSVQKIIHEMMMSSQHSGNGMVGVGSLGNDVKNVNGILRPNNNTSLDGGNNIVANGTANNSSIGVTGFRGMGNGLGQSAMVNGIRAAIGNNNSATMNGRVGMTMARDQNINHQQQDMSLLSGLGAVNGFNNLQFDWKTSP